MFPALSCSHVFKLCTLALASVVTSLVPPPFDEFARLTGHAASDRSQYEQLVSYVDRHNSKPDKTYTAAVTRWGIHKPAAGYNWLGAAVYRALKPPTQVYRATSAAQLQTTERWARGLDWRDYRPIIVPTVFDQGLCGCGWAVSATQVLASRAALAANRSVAVPDLSVQHVVSCGRTQAEGLQCVPDHSNGSLGCAGGFPQLAYELAASTMLGLKGIPNSFVRPYSSYYACADHFDSMNCKTESCGWPASIPKEAYPYIHNLVHVTAGGIGVVESNKEAAVLAALDQGPVVAIVDASKWHSYSSGLFDCERPANASINFDHAVQIHGYGTTQRGERYWLIRNR